MIRLAGLPDPYPIATRLVFTPDGRELAAGYRFRDGPDDDRGAVWWDWAAGTVVRRLRAARLAVGADGRFVSTLDPAERRPTVRAFAVGGDEPLAAVPVAGPDPAVAHLVLPGGGELLVRHFGRLGRHRLPGGAEAGRLRAVAREGGFGCSPSGRWLFSRTRRAVRFWDRHAGHRLVRLPADYWAVAAVSADDRLAAVSGPGGRRCELTVWDLGGRRPVWRADLPGTPLDFAWLPDGRLLTAHLGPWVYTWDAGRLAGRLEVADRGHAQALAVAPTGLVAAAAVYRADAASGAVVWDL